MTMQPSLSKASRPLHITRFFIGNLNDYITLTTFSCIYVYHQAGQGQSKLLGHGCYEAYICQ